MFPALRPRQLQPLLLPETRQPLTKASPQLFPGLLKIQQVALPPAAGLELNLQAALNLYLLLLPLLTLLGVREPAERRLRLM